MAYTGTPLPTYTGGLDFCQVTCLITATCIGFYAQGFYCYLMSSVSTVIFSSIGTGYLLSSNTIITNARSYIMMQLYQFNQNDILNTTAAVSSIGVTCDTVVGCTNVLVIPNAIGSASVNYKSNVQNGSNSTGYTLAVIPPARVYYTQASMFYTSYSLWKTFGNITYCSSTCDVFGACAGFLIDFTNICTFFLIMDTTNYNVNASYTAYLVDNSMISSIAIAMAEISGAILATTITGK